MYNCCMLSENENIFKLVNNFYRGKVVKSNINKIVYLIS